MILLSLFVVRKFRVRYVYKDLPEK